MAEAETSTTETTQTETPSEAAPAPSDPANNGTILGGDPEPEGGDPAANAEKPDGLEAPAVPETYELTAPDGFTLDPALIEAVTPDLKDAGLTNEQAQKILPAAVKFAESLKQAGEKQLISSVMAERKAWADEAKADPDIGGAKWDETVSFSAKALDALPESVGKPLRALLNDSGLGNKREMIAAMSFFGRAVGEDSIINGDGQGGKAPTAHTLYPNDVPKGG